VEQLTKVFGWRLCGTRRRRRASSCEERPAGPTLRLCDDWSSDVPGDDLHEYCRSFESVLDSLLEGHLPPSCPRLLEGCLT
jgi:hypothetical protein